MTTPVIADQRFASAYRLRKTDEYSSVFAFRRALKGRYIMLHYRPNEGLTARLGVIVAKKLAKRAVLRNLVKRIMREEFRLARASLPAHDIILRLSAPVREASRKQIHADIAALLARLPR